MRSATWNWIDRRGGRRLAPPRDAEPSAGRSCGMTETLARGADAVHLRVGRDLLPGGRVVRLLAGLLFLASVADGLLMESAGPLSWRTVGLVVFVFALAAAGYTALVAVLGERVLVR